MSIFSLITGMMKKDEKDLIESNIENTESELTESIDLNMCDSGYRYENNDIGESENEELIKSKINCLLNMAIEENFRVENIYLAVSDRPFNNEMIDLLKKRCIFVVAGKLSLVHCLTVSGRYFLLQVYSDFNSDLLDVSEEDEDIIESILSEFKVSGKVENNFANMSFNYYNQYKKYFYLKGGVILVENSGLFNSRYDDEFFDSLKAMPVLNKVEIINEDFIVYESSKVLEEYAYNRFLLDDFFPCKYNTFVMNNVASDIECLKRQIYSMYSCLFMEEQKIASLENKDYDDTIKQVIYDKAMENIKQYEEILKENSERMNFLMEYINMLENSEDKISRMFISNNLDI